MAMTLVGIGTAAPEHSIEQTHAVDHAVGISCQTEQQLRLLPVLYRRTGVGKRHSVLLETSSNTASARQTFYRSADGHDDMGPTTSVRMDRYAIEAPGLALSAARAALADGDVSPEEITHLVTVSCSGFHAPGFDVSLIRDLGLSPETSRTQIGFMGCHGALNALRVAKAFSEADANACVLICAVELCSLHYQYGWHPDRVVANALFADGAAAVIGRASSDTKPAMTWNLIDNGATLLPDSTDLMSWRIGDSGFEMTLSPRVPEVIHAHLKPWLTAWLATHDLTIADVGSWAIHPGGPRILQACAEAAELSADCLEESRGVLAEFGNMSSPTVLFIVERLRRRGADLPCVVLGFGPGLAIEAALIG